MHDGFHLTIQESEAPPVATALASPAIGAERQHFTCDYLYRSADRARDTVKSPRSWYPPNTLCSYRFTGKPNERVSVLLKIIREEDSSEDSESSATQHHKSTRKNDTNLDYCPGNEIVVYNGTQVDGSFLMWSFCDATHSDINNIQVNSPFIFYDLLTTDVTLLEMLHFLFSGANCFHGQHVAHTVLQCDGVVQRTGFYVLYNVQVHEKTSCQRDEEASGVVVVVVVVDFAGRNARDDIFEARGL